MPATVTLCFRSERRARCTQRPVCAALLRVSVLPAFVGPISQIDGALGHGGGPEAKKGPRLQKGDRKRGSHSAYTFGGYYRHARGGCAILTIAPKEKPLWEEAAAWTGGEPSCTRGGDLSAPPRCSDLAASKNSLLCPEPEQQPSSWIGGFKEERNTAGSATPMNRNKRDPAHEKWQRMSVAAKEEAQQLPHG